MIKGILALHWLFRLAIAIPAIIMLGRYATAGGGLGQLLQASGEWAARLLILALAVTPIRMMFKGQRWTMWLFKRRRDLGLAAFSYSVLHLFAYALRQANLTVILHEALQIAFLMGWAAFLGMTILAATSSNDAVHSLGTRWKWLQRLVYPAALAVFLHWIWIKHNVFPSYIHFAPLVVLEGYRLVYNITRRRHAE